MIFSILWSLIFSLHTRPLWSVDKSSFTVHTLLLSLAINLSLFLDLTTRFGHLALYDLEKFLGETWYIYSSGSTTLVFKMNIYRNALMLDDKFLYLYYLTLYRSIYIRCQIFVLLLLNNNFT